MTADGWTVADARGEFAKTGIPFDGLGKFISLLPGFRRIGEKPSGASGGRGAAIYDVGDLQQLHGFLAGRGWLVPQDPPPGDT